MMPQDVSGLLGVTSLPQTKVNSSSLCQNCHVIVTMDRCKRLDLINFPPHEACLGGKRGGTCWTSALERETQGK